MIQQLQGSPKRNRYLRATNEMLFYSLVICTPCRVGIDQNNLIFKGSCDTQGIHEFDFRVGIMLNALACILKTPKAGADNNVHVLPDQSPEYLRKHYIPANNQAYLPVPGI